MTASITRRPVVIGDVARIALTRGQTAIIDVADVDLVARWCWSVQWAEETHSYYAIKAHGPQTLMHRLVMSAARGVLIDHANHDTLDNRRSNLRIATRSDNARNVRAARSDGPTEYIGVGYARNCSRRPWRARARVNGVRQHIGCYVTPVDAALARDQWVRTHHPSDFAVYNFPRPTERGITRAKEIA